MSHTGGHLLQLYEDDDFLCDLVTEYLVGGLQMDERLLVIANETHREQLTHSLRAHPWDFEEALAAGRVIMADADALMPSLCVGGPADHSSLTPLFADLLPRGDSAHVRIFGELAGMSWSRGQPSVCTAVEQAWNQLAQEHSFTLLCSYRVNLTDSATASALADICGLHTQVLPSEHCISRGRLSERLRYLFMIEQTLALRNAELSEARQTELQLRQTIAALRDRVAWSSRPPPV